MTGRRRHDALRKAERPMKPGSRSRCGTKAGLRPGFSPDSDMRDTSRGANRRTLHKETGKRRGKETVAQRMIEAEVTRVTGRSHSACDSIRFVSDDARRLCRQCAGRLPSLRMEEEDGRPGPRSRQSDTPRAPRDAAASSLCLGRMSAPGVSQSTHLNFNKRQTEPAAFFWR